MGNYSDFETDFVQRTLALIDQYNERVKHRGVDTVEPPLLTYWVCKGFTPC